MLNKNTLKRSVSAAAVLMAAVLGGTTAYAAPATATSTAPADKPAFKPEELEQILAPIALYPDDLLSQMLMASTYPLEIVQADRWIKQNKDVKGDALTKALEAQSWDASVKSLVNVPDVLAMMSDKLDLTIKLGDAFIGQPKDVMATVQKLRGKAQDTGNLKTTPEQKVIVEKQAETQVIVIESANPQVMYVPTYPPTVYYPTWPYPAYPPAPYYPPGYIAGSALAFGAGIAVGAAWGYAWGNCNWNGGNVDIDVDRNTNINRNIDRSKAKSQIQSRNSSVKNGQGSFRHDPAHRQGVAYRDQKTASQFGRTTPANTAKARESARGIGNQELSRGNAGGAANRPNTGAVNRPNTGAGGAANRPNTGAAANRPNTGAANRPAQNNALSGVNRGGTAARTDSSRGNASRSAPSRPAPSRSSGGGARPSGGGARPSGGGGRSGGGGGRR